MNVTYHPAVVVEFDRSDIPRMSLLVVLRYARLAWSLNRCSER